MRYFGPLISGLAIGIGLKVAAPDLPTDSFVWAAGIIIVGDLIGDLIWEAGKK